jgi:hypothetical protein
MDGTGLAERLTSQFRDQQRPPKWQMEQPERTKLAREVLAYLAEHSDSQDTLEGIVEWWLLDREVKTWTKNVKDALVARP